MTLFLGLWRELSVRTRGVVEQKRSVEGRRGLGVGDPLNVFRRGGLG